MEEVSVIVKIICRFWCKFEFM